MQVALFKLLRLDIAAHYLWAVLTWAVTAMDSTGSKTNIAE